MLKSWVLTVELDEEEVLLVEFLGVVAELVDGVADELFDGVKTGSNPSYANLIPAKFNLSMSPDYMSFDESNRIEITA